MALSTIGRNQLNTGIDDNSDATAITIDSSERVGIGTTSPSFNFHATTSTGSDFAGFFQNTAGSGNGTSLVAKGGANNASPNFQVQDFNGNADFTVLGNGNAGVGTTSPSDFGGTTLQPNPASTYSANLVSSGTHVLQMIASQTHGAMSIGARSNHHVAFTTNDTERMRIDTSGRVLINRTSNSTAAPHSKLSVLGDSAVSVVTLQVGTNGYSAIVVLNASGTSVGTIVANASSTAYNTSSDHRLKENVDDMTGAIDRVKALAPKRFNFIEDADTTLDGFLAHEAQTVVPEAVTGTKDEVDDDGNAVMQGIDQSKLVPLLTGALQEAIAKIEVLEARVTALEGA